jgi:N-acetylglucosamine malate deacetylase 1
MREFPHPRSLGAIEHLAGWRGACAGLLAAEAFMLGRMVA